MTINTSKSVISIAITLFSGAISAATIYECRTYKGSTFYSDNYCSQSNAIGVSNHSVPDDMTFKQQVRFAKGAKAREHASSRAENTQRLQTAADQANEADKRALQCEQLDRAIAARDEELLQPHSAQRGDYLTGKRKKLMDRRFSLRC